MDYQLQRYIGKVKITSLMAFELLWNGPSLMFHKINRRELHAVLIYFLYRYKIVINKIPDHFFNGKSNHIVIRALNPINQKSASALY